VTDLPFSRINETNVELRFGSAMAREAANNATDSPRVLVVDDNRDAANTLTRLLNLLGLPASATFSGQSALDEIENCPPALIFLDLGMPGMDGVETAKRIRASEHGERIKLVALTGLGRHEDIALTRSAGFAAHLVKPVNLTLLEQTLTTYLGYQSQVAPEQPTRGDSSSRQ
jgi:CheY-like chemotaxis protein